MQIRTVVGFCFLLGIQALCGILIALDHVGVILLLLVAAEASGKIGMEKFDMVPAKIDKDRHSILYFFI